MAAGGNTFESGISGIVGNIGNVGVVRRIFVGAAFIFVIFDPGK